MYPYTPHPDKICKAASGTAHFGAQWFFRSVVLASKMKFFEFNNNVYVKVVLTDGQLSFVTTELTLDECYAFHRQKPQLRFTILEVE